MQANVSPRYSHIDFTPTPAMAAQAETGLDWWRKLDGRGGNEMALARAWRIRRNAALSPDVIRRMAAHMAQLEQRKLAIGWDEGQAGYPSHSRVTWSLMGGDAGFAWARAIVAQMDAADLSDADLRPNSRAGTLLANAAETREEDGMLIVPVVALVPGVVNGMLVTEAELSTHPVAWNGRPVTLRHPRVGNTYVTANDPAMLQRQRIGSFFNVEFSDGKLKGEIWLDLAACAQVGDEALAVLEGLRAGTRFEVSTGYFCEILDEAGESGGREYDGVQVNLRPDHLAILPDEIGACSWADGCGTPRVNVLVTNSVLANADYSDDVMVAFFLRDQAMRHHSHVDAWPEGAQPTALEEYHVTLAYLGEITALEAAGIDYNRAAVSVSEFAKHSPALFARVSGVGRFNAGPDMPEAVHLSIDSRELQHMRADLVGYLEASGVPVSHAHGFTPHITLGYVPADAPVDLRTPAPSDLAVDSIALAWGRNVTNFALQGETYVLPAANAEENSTEEISAMCECTSKAREEKTVTNTAAADTQQIEQTTAPVEKATSAAPVTNTAESSAAAAHGRVAEAARDGEQAPVPSEADTLVAAFGGLDTVRTMLEQFQANARAEQGELVGRLTANARCTFSADELRTMPMDVLRKLDASLRPSDYSLRPTANSKADNAVTMYGQTWTPYQTPVDTEGK